ncbi:hypothetical protein Efla_001361 [Eimeria flavescens]
MAAAANDEEEQAAGLSLRSGDLQQLLTLQRLGLECPSDDARILDLQRQLHDVTAELEFKKASYAQVLEKARQQDLELQKKQGQLTAQLQRFQKFVLTNEEKTIRANKRASANKENSQVRAKEIAALQRQLALDEAACAEIEAQVEGLQKLADYLTAVSKASPEFSSVSDVISRYESLACVHADLVKSEQQTLEAMDALRQEMREYKSKQAANILEANNKVAAYQHELEVLEKETAALSAKAEEAANDSFTQSAHLGKIFFAVENMFATCIHARPSIQHGRKAWERQRREAAEAAGETPQEKEGGPGRQQQRKEQIAAEKETAEGTPLQRRCRDAIELLEAIKLFITDFKDIDEQLNKGEKKKQKACRTVNMAVEKPDEEIVEIVAMRLQAATRRDTGSTDTVKRTASRRIAEDNSSYQQQTTRTHIPSAAGSLHCT